MMRPRELAEVALDSAADLFTVPVTGDEAIDYLQLAQPAAPRAPDRPRPSGGHRPAARADERGATSPGVDSRRADPPAGRRAAMAAATPAHLRDRRRTAFARLRYQLRAAHRTAMAASAGRHGFVCVSSAAEWWTCCHNCSPLAGNEVILIDQMLLDCYRLLLRSPGDMPIDVSRLRHNLLRLPRLPGGAARRAGRRHGRRPTARRPEPAHGRQLPCSPQAP